MVYVDVYDLLSHVMTGSAEVARLSGFAEKLQPLAGKGALIPNKGCRVTKVCSGGGSESSSPSRRRDTTLFAPNIR